MEGGLKLFYFFFLILKIRLRQILPFLFHSTRYSAFPSTETVAELHAFNLPIIKERSRSWALVIVGRVSISSAINLSESRLLSRDLQCLFLYTWRAVRASMDFSFLSFVCLFFFLSFFFLFFFLFFQSFYTDVRFYSSESKILFQARWEEWSAWILPGYPAA